MRAILPLILFGLLGLLAITPAMAEETDTEMIAVKAVMVHCITPIALGHSVAELAVKENMPEISADKAALFLASEGGGRVFAVPQDMGNIVLKAPDSGACGVAIRQLDAAKFWNILDKMFAPDVTPWKFLGEESRGGSMTKRYKADFQGNMLAIISVREAPVEDQLQALVTVGRYKDDPSK